MKYVNFTQQFIDVHYEVFTIKLVKMFTGVITDDILNAIDLADNHHTPINLEMWASRATRTHLTPPPYSSHWRYACDLTKAILNMSPSHLR